MESVFRAYWQAEAPYPATSSQPPAGAAAVRSPAGEAEDVLPDQTFFTVDAPTFAKFQALLDKPLPPTYKLRRLLKTKAPWDA